MEQLILFDRKEMYLQEHNARGRLNALNKMSTRLKRKMIHENMHLMKYLTFSSNLHYPQMEPCCGTVDFDYVSYCDRNKHDGKNEALHFFLDDYRFRDAVWCNLELTTYSISKFDYVFTPDLSMWIDLPTDFYNKENVYRTRFIGAYWQYCGFNVIPTASWGDLASFAYCFEGLPTHSIIAVSGMGSRRSSMAFGRWCYGIRRLEEALSPMLIIVYGEKVELQGLRTPVTFIPCFIHEKLRKI